MIPLLFVLRKEANSQIKNFTSYWKLIPLFKTKRGEICDKPEVIGGRVDNYMKSDDVK